MTRSYGVRDFYREAIPHRDRLRAALDQLNARRSAHDTRSAEVRSQRDELLVQLTRQLLPDLTSASTDRAGRLSAYTDLLNGNPARVLDAERLALQKELAAIEADERYADREHGKVKASTELEELQEFRAPLATILNRGTHLRMGHLLDNGYGTDDYSVGWWRLSFYADWKAGDEILERYPEFDDFGQLRKQFLEARDAVAQYDARIAELDGAIQVIRGLEQSHDHHTHSLANLETDHLERWRQGLGRHIMSIDPAGLADRFSQDPGAELLLKSVIGLNKKVLYLDELAREVLDPFEAQLTKELAKIERHMVKYRRPKHAYAQFPADKFEKRFRDRSDKYAKRWKRYDRTYDRIYGFNGYERGRLAEDFLWWDLMTDGEIDGDFCDEVRTFRRDHPSYRWERDDLDDSAAAAAIATADRAEEDDLFSFDAS